MIYLSSEIAKNLHIDQRQCEFISCYPVDEGRMTEIVFLLLSSNIAPKDNNTRDDLFLNHHLGPRQLAAELAALIADPRSGIYQSITVCNAHSLNFKIAGRLYKSGSSAAVAELDADFTSTASTISEDMHSDNTSETYHEPEPRHETSEGHHPLRCIEGRLATFVNWSQGTGIVNKKKNHQPSSMALSPLALARAGFYQIMDPEHECMVRCAYCRLEIALRHGTAPSIV